MLVSTILPAARYYADTTPGVLAIIVRHSKTVLNNPKNPRVRGWIDAPLSPEGVEIARQTAMRLRQYSPKYIFSSDFQRDTQTANIIAEICGISGWEIEFDARTWDVGDYSGQLESDVNAAIFDLYQRPYDAPPGSRESFNDFSRRWLNFTERKFDLASKVSAFRPVVLVTHGRNVALTDSELRNVSPTDGYMPMPGQFALINVEKDRSLTIEFVGPKEQVIKDV